MLPILWILIGMVSVQLGASFAKQLFPIIGPIATVVLRITFAAIILTAIWRPWRTKLNIKNYKSILLYGICLGVMNLTFYLSLTRIPLGICVALEFAGPLAVALFASKQKIDFLWAFLAALGIVLILPIHPGQQALDPIGILLALIAGLCWALYIVFGKDLSSSVHGGVATSLGMIVASFTILPVSFTNFQFSNFTPQVWVAAIGVAILSSAIPYTVEMFAMKRIPTKTFGILMSVEPAIAALSGMVILREQLASSQWIAILCVILASAGSAKTSRAPETVALAQNQV